jgi:hypothetical protein
MRYHWQILGVAGASLLGLAAYWLWGRGKQIPSALPMRRGLVLYNQSGTGAGVFRSTARMVQAAYGGQALPVDTGEDIRQALTEVAGPLNVVVFTGHGSTQSFFRPGRSGIRVGQDALPSWLSVESVARLLAPKLASGAVVSLAGCRAAANPGEPDWNPANFAPGGERSFAARLRDALVRAGARISAVRGKTVTGVAFGAPRGREFGPEVGSVGRPVVFDSAGKYSIEWTIGGAEVGAR